MADTLSPRRSIRTAEERSFLESFPSERQPRVGKSTQSDTSKPTEPLKQQLLQYLEMKNRVIRNTRTAAVWKEGNQERFDSFPRELLDPGFLRMIDRLEEAYKEEYPRRRKITEHRMRNEKLPAYFSVTQSRIPDMRDRFQADVFFMSAMRGMLKKKSTPEPQEINGRTLWDAAWYPYDFGDKKKMAHAHLTREVGEFYGFEVTLDFVEPWRYIDIYVNCESPYLIDLMDKFPEKRRQELLEQISAVDVTF